MADKNSEVSINERILKECNSMYTHPELGLIQISSEFGLKLLAPRKKVVILLIGNHSAGKSSFINWYIEEHVQKTGVAIETQGFTLVSSGRKRESLMGNATLHLYPHFKPLQQIPGVIDFLSTEISASKQKEFPLVTFVDTPGLVDGDMNYPFDVNAAVLWLGAMADLVFVFFDPIGQALCRRTLNLVEALNAAHADKMRFYLSKADEAGNESDRQRVLMQIVQELCKRPGLNRTCFDMPTIYIPELNKTSTCMNHIDDVCHDIEKTINRSLQNALNMLEKDFNQLHKMIKERLEKDQEAQKHNQTVLLIRIMVSIAPMILALFIFVNLFNEKILESIAGHETAKTLATVMNPVKELYTIIPMDILFTLVIIPIVYFIWIRRWNGFKPTLSKNNKKKYVQMMKHIECKVSDKQKKLYRLYLEQSVADQDL